MFRTIFIVFVVVVMIGGRTASAQLRQNDVRATGSLDLYYKIAPDWTFNVYAETLLDHDLDRWSDVLFRPNITYSLSPAWAVSTGYVQFQPIEATFKTERGAYQDVFYFANFGKLSMLNRLRFNETFADQSSALLILSSYLIELDHPIGESPWFAYLSNEPFFNLKVDGTGRQAGFQLNKTIVGIGRSLTPKTAATLGYELSELNVQSVLYTAHTFKFGVTIHFN